MAFQKLNVSTTPYQAVLPKRGARFGDDDSQIEPVWKRPVSGHAVPVVRDDGVVSSKTIRERSNEDGIHVGVDATVFQHDVGSPNIT